MKVLLDACLSPDWKPALEQAGLSCCHWFSIGPWDASDKAIMQWAASHDHLILTGDLDYGHLLLQAEAHAPSVVILRCDDVRPAVLSARLLQLLRAHEKDLQDGALMVVDTLRARVRLLPLHPSHG